MAFVWSRLALAALLAAGAACGVAEACPDGSGAARTGDAAPQLACPLDAPTMVSSTRAWVDDDGLALTAESPRLAAVVRVAIDVTQPIAIVVTAASDVLDVAPKTSPPRS